MWDERIWGRDGSPRRYKWQSGVNYPVMVVCAGNKKGYERAAVTR